MWRSVLVLGVSSLGCSFRGPAAIGDANPRGDDGRAIDSPQIGDASLVDGVAIDAAIDAATAMIDAAADAKIGTCDLAAFSCASGEILANCNGGCWASCTEALPEPIAKQRCAAWGGRLAYAHSASDDSCIANTIFGQNVASWIGYEQALAQATPSTGWSWPDGSPYVNWAGGQPTDATPNVESDVDDCAYESTSGAWHSAPCATMFKWSCRL